MDELDTPIAVALLIVDPEDTLYNGRPLRIRALAQALETQISSGKMDVPIDAQVDYQYLAARIEERIDSAAAILHNEAHLRQLLDQVEAIHSQLLETEAVEPFSHVGKILQKEKDFGRELAFYSHCSRDALLAVIEQLRIEHLVGFSSCTRDAGRSTTAGGLPDILENLQFFPEESLLISNNPLVLTQARAMNIYRVACRWGNPSREILPLADFMAESPQSLQKMLRKVRGICLE